MRYTQVEISLGNKRDVIWLPVPEGKAKVGEKITRIGYDYACAPTENPEVLEDWIISQVCITMDENSLPPKAKKADKFNRKSTTTSHITI